MTRGKAKLLRQLIESLAAGLDDAAALTGMELFPAWAVGKAYAIDDRVQYNGALYKCVQAHTSQADWMPPAAPSLFAEVLPGQGGTAIGEWQQPDSTNPYQKGDKVTHNGKTWESTADNNVWEPGVYGWTEV